MNNNDAVAENEVEATTQDSSPQSEEETISPQTQQEETQVESDETTAEVSDSKDVESSMTPEQRKAFQEMRLENKRFKEEQQSRKSSESAFDIFKPKPINQGVDPNSYVSPITGEIDWISYNNAVISQASTAASQVVQEQLDIDRAQTMYPEVFANPKLEKALAGHWFAEKMQGKNVSVTELAADYAELVQESVKKAEKVAEKRGAQQALSELTPKEAASLQAQGTTSAQARNELSLEDQENLKLRARRGDDDAMAQLMRNVAWKK